MMGIIEVAAKSRVVMTAGASDILGTQLNAEALANRHRKLDWGLATAPELDRNRQNIVRYGELISRFRIRGVNLVVYTSEGWKTTIVARGDEL